MANQTASLADAQRSDIFLSVQTKRAGKIKGEGASDGHIDDIIVLGWHWGMRSNAAMLSSGGANGDLETRSYTALTVHKGVDRASTALMAALKANDEVKEAKLTLRRAGSGQEAYFVITLKDARVDSVEITTDDQGYPRETVALMFTKVHVEYKPQQGTGLRGGSTSFEDEIYRK